MVGSWRGAVPLAAASREDSTCTYWRAFGAFPRREFPIVREHALAGVPMSVATTRRRGQLLALQRMK